MWLIEQAKIANEGRVFDGYLTVEGDRIGLVGEGEPPVELRAQASEVLNVNGALVMPGVIDDQVHFREPGLTEKGDIATESRAALAGGVTSYMEMPNTKPPATTLELLEEKYARAAEVSAVNYSFYLGATNDNLAEIERVDPSKICGVKVFMGSSTGNMLVDSEEALAGIFSRSPVLVAAHCEQEEIIRANLESARIAFGDAIPPSMHPIIRSAEACYRSSAHAVELAHRHGGRLHVLHLSTGRELDLFEQNKPIEEKRVTCEVCVHHLWFSDIDYTAKGNLIKWNPAIKTSADRDSLRAGVRNGRVDVVATDHAPHLLSEKEKPYLQAPSGGPLVQHSLPAMLTMVQDGIFTLAEVVQRMCHAPARLFRVKERGFLRPGYYADLAIVSLDQAWTVERGPELLYKCGWSPFEGIELKARVLKTILNGQVAYDRENPENQGVSAAARGRRLEFNV